MREHARDEAVRLLRTHMREREYVYMCMCVYALGSMLPSEVLARPELLCGSGARGRAGLLLTPTGMRLEMLRGICGRGKVQGPSHLLPPDSEILLGDLSRAPKPPVPQCGDGEGQDTAAQPPWHIAACGIFTKVRSGNRTCELVSEVRASCG